MEAPALFNILHRVLRKGKSVRIINGFKYHSRTGWTVVLRHPKRTEYRGKPIYEEISFLELRTRIAEANLQVKVLLAEKLKTT